MDIPAAIQTEASSWLSNFQKSRVVRAALEAEEKKVDEAQFAERLALLDQRPELEAAMAALGSDLADLQKELSALDRERESLLAKINAHTIAAQQAQAALSENGKRLHPLGEEHVAYAFNRLSSARFSWAGEIRFLDGAMIPPKAPGFYAEKDPDAPARVVALRRKIAAAERAEKTVAGLAFSRKSPAEIRAAITQILSEAGINLEFVKVVP